MQYIYLLQVPGAELFYSLNATIVGLAVGSEDLHKCVGLGRLLFHCSGYFQF